MTPSLDTKVETQVNDAARVAARLLARARRRGRCLVLPARPGRYPTVRLRGRTAGAHRVVFQAFNGEIPAGLFVLHRCVGHRDCVEPTHLRAGTARENSADMVRAGRSTRGVRNANVKLNPGAVRQARRDARRGRSFTELAAAAGVSRQAIGQAVHRQTWGWLR